MTYAPDDLKAVQRLLQEKTGLPWASLGITHQKPDGGGYHEGRDLLALAHRAPGPQYPHSDYSYAESVRDLAGMTDAASAVDIGQFSELRNMTLDLVMACRLGDPRTLDIREVIYTPDGRTVARWDREKQRASGDDSHLSHTHVSFYRDSEGRRHHADNFFGWLMEWFNGGATPIAKSHVESAQEEEDDMAGGIPPTEIPATGTGSYTIWPVNSGAAGHGPAWLNVCNDTFGADYGLRIWASKGDGAWYDIADKGVFKSGQRTSYTLPEGTACLSIGRTATKTGAPSYTGHLTFAVEYARRG